MKLIVNYAQLKVAEAMCVVLQSRLHNVIESQPERYKEAKQLYRDLGRTIMTAATPYNEPKPEPTQEQLAAIRQFARSMGRTWKAELREAWMSGNYPDGDTALLQQIRNSFGPAWLVKFKLEVTK